MKNAVHLKDVVKNETTGNQVVVLDELALLITVVTGNHSFAAKSKPLGKAVKRLTFVGCASDMCGKIRNNG